MPETRINNGKDKIGLSKKPLGWPAGGLHRGLDAREKHLGSFKKVGECAKKAFSRRFNGGTHSKEPKRTPGRGEVGPCAEAGVNGRACSNFEKIQRRKESPQRDVYFGDETVKHRGLSWWDPGTPPPAGKECR